MKNNREVQSMEVLRQPTAGYYHDHLNCFNLCLLSEVVASIFTRGYGDTCRLFYNCIEGLSLLRTVTTKYDSDIQTALVN